MACEDYWLQSPITSMTVERVDPGRTLVLQGHDGGTWMFHLDPIDEETTRFIVRDGSRRTEQPSGTSCAISHTNYRISSWNEE